MKTEFTPGLLIAAAPEMFEALQKNLTWLMELPDIYEREAESFEGSEKQMYLDHAQTVRERIKQTKNVIAKATGKKEGEQ